MKTYTRDMVRRAADHMVTNTNDSGSGALRQAIVDAGAGETITFDLTYPATITLTTGELDIDENLTIIGPGADQLAIDGNNASRVFHIDFCDCTVEISGLTIEHGLASDGDNGFVSDGDKGGGIYSRMVYLTLAVSPSAATPHTTVAAGGCSTRSALGTLLRGCRTGASRH
jgi:hypothetical protein